MGVPVAAEVRRSQDLSMRPEKELEEESVYYSLTEEAEEVGCPE